MSDESTFRALLSERPDDTASWLVYADWLESTGETQRAAVVRVHCELVAQAKHLPRLAIARRLLDVAKGLPRGWLAQFPSRHVLVDECWGARDCYDGVYLVRFRPDGTLLFKQGDAGDSSDPPDEQVGDGSWMQIGDAFTFSIAAHNNRKNDFSRQDGVLTPNKKQVSLAGIGSNSDGEIWTWKLAQLAAAEFDDDDLPVLPDKPKDSKSRGTGKGEHVLPKRRWT